MIVDQKKWILTGRKAAKIGWVVLAIMLVTLLVACGSQNGQQTATALPLEISVQQAATLRDQGAFILDVREPDEWVQFHIPGATLIPLGDLPNRSPQRFRPGHLAQCRL